VPISHTSHISTALDGRNARERDLSYFDRLFADTDQTKRLSQADNNHWIATAGATFSGQVFIKPADPFAITLLDLITICRTKLW
jgi:hypothetical protein